MASRELYSSIGKPKPKKLNFGQQIGEYGKVLADTALSGIGMSDVISDEAYKADWAKKVSSITSPLANVAGSIAPMLMGAPTGPAIFAKGGLRTFEGPTHEQGGIQLAGDEVEGNETMMPMDSQSDFIFSDRLYPIKSISPKGKITFSKKSFAQLSKQINKPLELRPNDPYAKKTADIKLGKLAQEQEALKQSNNTEQFAMGGKRYDGGGGRLGIYPDYLNPQSPTGLPVYNAQGKEAYLDKEAWGKTPAFPYKSNRVDGITVKNYWDFPHRYYGTPQTLFDKAGYFNLQADPYFNNRGIPSADAYIDVDLPPKDWGREDIESTISKAIEANSPYISTRQARFPNLKEMTPKGITPTTVGIQPIQNKQAASTAMEKHLRDGISADTDISSNFLPSALGYAAQAATNLPAFFMKPDTVNLPRVKFDDISLAEQRNEARRSRNLGLASARGIGATDAGQMMNYLSGTTAALNSVYGNQFNQSLLQEQQANAEMNMREQLANSEIERYDEQINAQERDAARALRMNALQNLGTIAAGAGRDYMAMQENDAMMNVLMGSNPDYTYDVNTPTGRMKWLKSKTLTPKRRKNNG